MSRRLPLAVAATLLALVSVISGAGRADAADPSDQPGGAKVYASIDGGNVVSGDAVVLDAWFLQGPDRCYDFGTGVWSLDGVELDDTIVSAGEEDTPPAGLLPPGDYFLDENVFDATTTTNGPHVLTVEYDDYTCDASATPYAVTASVAVTVDNTGPHVTPTTTTVSGTTAQLPLAVTPNHNVVNEIDVAGDLVKGGSASFDGSVTAATLDLTNAVNGLHRLTVTATDDGGLSTIVTSVVTVANHRVLRLGGARTGRHGHRVAVQIAVSPVATSVPVLLQQLAGSRWQTIGKAVAVGTSGRVTAMVRCSHAGSRRLRAITASATVYPGASATEVLRCR